MKTAEIPLDDRYNVHKPKITNGMKGACIGELSFTTEEPCPKCTLHLEGHYDDVECLCDGSEDGVYERKIVVPWNTCKEIYKAMAMVAINS